MVIVDPLGTIKVKRATMIKQTGLMVVCYESDALKIAVFDYQQAPGTEQQSIAPHIGGEPEVIKGFNTADFFMAADENYVFGIYRPNDEVW
jgi:hypothetical protein